MGLGPACAALLAASSLGCAGTEKTELTIRVGNFWGQQQYRLLCDPPVGDVDRPEALCDLIARNQDLMLRDASPHVGCLGGLGTISLHVQGRFKGRRVDDDVSSCSGNVEAEKLWLTELPAPPSPPRRRR